MDYVFKTDGFSTKPDEFSTKSDEFSTKPDEFSTQMLKWMNTTSDPEEIANTHGKRDKLKREQAEADESKQPRANLGL